VGVQEKVGREVREVRERRVGREHSEKRMRRNWQRTAAQTETGRIKFNKVGSPCNNLTRSGMGVCVVFGSVLFVLFQDSEHRVNSFAFCYGSNLLPSHSRCEH
jgi:hypothetical protein